METWEVIGRELLIQIDYVKNKGFPTVGNVQDIVLGVSSWMGEKGRMLEVRCKILDAVSTRDCDHQGGYWDRCAYKQKKKHTGPQKPNWVGFFLT